MMRRTTTQCLPFKVSFLESLLLSFSFPFIIISVKSINSFSRIIPLFCYIGKQDMDLMLLWRVNFGAKVTSISFSIRN